MKSSVSWDIKLNSSVKFNRRLVKQFKLHIPDRAKEESIVARLSTLKMEAACSSATLADIFTRRGSFTARAGFFRSSSDASKVDVFRLLYMPSSGWNTVLNCTQFYCYFKDKLWGQQ
jgi:hypothetical protein